MPSNKDLVFATHNQHKTREVQALLNPFTVLSLTDIHFNQEIEETGSTFIENANIKAKTVYQQCQKNLFADDSGLVIPALNGEPGIYSARYAKTGDAKDNIQKVLTKLGNNNHREAYFIAVICLIWEGETHYFEGKINGTITCEVKGSNGFGYDPIFIPVGYEKSFAEISAAEKNRISHRALAINGMKSFLEEYFI